MIFPFLLTDGYVGTHPGITLPPFNVSNDSVYVTNLTCPDHLTHCLAHSVTSKACSSGYLTITCQRGTVQWVILKYKNFVNYTNFPSILIRNNMYHVCAHAQLII